MPPRGFTLIELLVVIAVVGMLASIVLAALGGTRTQASDAAIKEELTQAQTQMELYHSAHNDYGPRHDPGVCQLTCETPQCEDNIFYAEEKVNTILTDSDNRNGSADVLCGAGGGNNPAKATSWAVAAQLHEDGPWWCVDSHGYRGEVEIPVPCNTYACLLAPPLSGGGDADVFCISL